MGTDGVKQAEKREAVRRALLDFWASCPGAAASLAALLVPDEAPAAPDRKRADACWSCAAADGKILRLEAELAEVRALLDDHRVRVEVLEIERNAAEADARALAELAHRNFECDDIAKGPIFRSLARPVREG